MLVHVTLLSVRMKLSLILAVVTLGLTSASFVTHTDQVKNGDIEWVKKQEDLFLVLKYVHQPYWNPQLVSYGKHYIIKEHYDNYNSVELVHEFVDLWEKGFLPKHHIFSIYNEEHREQAIALFNVFYYAKDWDTFYKSVAWARFNVNEGMFIYAITVAVTHRKDMEGMILPPVYEICPYYFVSSEVIQKAHNHKMTGFVGVEKIDGMFEVVIPTNYTGWYQHSNLEQKLTYFTEDIGLNSYYYYLHTDYPFWMNGDDFGLNKDRRGELFLYEHQQILARYYLERLSNNMGHIPEFSWSKPIATGYYPSLQFFNGRHFQVRGNNYDMSGSASIENVKEYERRIRDLIDFGTMTTADNKIIDLKKPESVDVLGNLIQCNADSVDNKYYSEGETFARFALSASHAAVGDYGATYGVLENFETSLRDPLFYQYYKHIIGYYWKFNAKLEPYPYEQLLYPGVKIESVKIDKLQTYFDKFDIDITNTMGVPQEQYVEGTEDYPDVENKPDKYIVKARSVRLNHKPFSFTLNVLSEVSRKAVVRVFIGPKYDEYGNLYTINDNRENFVKLDVFLYDLKTGKNVITRKSSDFSGYVQDQTTYYELYKDVMKAMKGESKWTMDMKQAHCGFPDRLMLPKGTKGGMTYQFYFVVTPFYEPVTPQYKDFDPIVSCGVGSGSRYIDRLSFGYPLDRTVDETFFFVPNMHFEDVDIFFKPEGETGYFY